MAKVAATLTPRQRRFVAALVSNPEVNNPLMAYKAAGYSVTSDRVGRANAETLRKKPAVAAEIERLQQEAAQNVVMTIQKRYEALTDIANDRDISTADRLKAIDLLNRMDSVYINKSESINSNLNINVTLQDND